MISIAAKLHDGSHMPPVPLSRPSTYGTQSLPIAVPLPAFWYQHHQQQKQHSHQVAINEQEQHVESSNPGPSQASSYNHLYKQTEPSCVTSHSPQQQEAETSLASTLPTDHHRQEAHTHHAKYDIASGSAAVAVSLKQQMASAHQSSSSVSNSYQESPRQQDHSSNDHVQANLRQFEAARQQLAHGPVASTSSGRPFRRALSVDAVITSSSSSRPKTDAQTDVQYSLVTEASKQSASSSTTGKAKAGENKKANRKHTNQESIPATSVADLSNDSHISYAYDDDMEADSPPAEGDMSFEHQDPSDLAARFSSVSQIEAHPTLCPETGQAVYPCPFCDKHYGGKHARSIWRRHLSNKHGIPLNLQPRRTRWDNDINRPKDSAERHKRTLESKRRWAAKNRAEKRAKRKGTTVEEEMGLEEAGSDGKNGEYYYGDDTAGEESFNGLTSHAGSTPQEAQQATSPYVPAAVAPTTQSLQSVPAGASLHQALANPALDVPTPAAQEESRSRLTSVPIIVQSEVSSGKHMLHDSRGSTYSQPVAVPSQLVQPLTGPNPSRTIPQPPAGPHQQRVSAGSASAEPTLQASQIQFIPYQRQQHVRPAASPITLAPSPVPPRDMASPVEASFQVMDHEQIQFRPSLYGNGYMPHQGSQPASDMHAMQGYTHPSPIYSSYPAPQDYNQQTLHNYHPSSLLQVQPSESYATSASMSASNSTRSLSPMAMSDQQFRTNLGYHLAVPPTISGFSHYGHGLQRSVSEPGNMSLSFRRPDGHSPTPLDLSKISSQRAYSPLDMQHEHVFDNAPSQHTPYDNSLHTPEVYAYYPATFSNGVHAAYQADYTEGHVQDVQQPPTPYFYLSVPDSTPNIAPHVPLSVQQQRLTPVPDLDYSRQSMAYQASVQSQESVQPLPALQESQLTVQHMTDSASSTLPPPEKSAGLDKSTKRRKERKSSKKRASGESSKASKKKRKDGGEQQGSTEVEVSMARPSAPRATSVKTYQEAAMQLLALKTSSSSPPASPCKELLGLGEADDDGNTDAAVNMSLRGSEVQLDRSIADSGYGGQDSIMIGTKNIQRPKSRSIANSVPDEVDEHTDEDEYNQTRTRFASIPPSSPALRMSLSPASSPLPVVPSKLSATYLRSIARSTPASKHSKIRSKHDDEGHDENARQYSDMEGADKISLDSSPIREEQHPRSKRSLLTSSPISPRQTRVRNKSRSPSPNRHTAGSSFATSVVMSTPHAAGPFFSQHSSLLDSAPGLKRQNGGNGGTSAKNTEEDEGGEGEAETDIEAEPSKAGFHKNGLPARIFKIDNCSRPSAGLGMSSSSSPARPFLLSSPEHAAVSKSLGLVPDNFTHTSLSLPSDPEGFEMHFLRGFGSTSLGMAEYAKDVFGGPLDGGKN